MGSGSELMYDNNNVLSNGSSKYNNRNIEADDRKEEEQKQQEEFRKQQQEQHWTYKLFVEHPELFLSALEKGKEKAVREAEGLCRIFDEYKIPKDSNFRFVLRYRPAFYSFG